MFKPKEMDHFKASVTKSKRINWLKWTNYLKTILYQISLCLVCLNFK